MQLSKNVPFYLAALFLFIALKLWFSAAGVNDLAFLIKPANKFTELTMGSQSVYVSDSGYYHEKLNIIIGKSCCGYNYFIMCFLLFSYLFIKYSGKPLYKALSIILSVIITYLLTIFVNTSRIFISIIAFNQTSQILPDYQGMIHRAIGIFTYLSFLALAYLFADKILNNRKYHEKHN